MDRYRTGFWLVALSFAGAACGEAGDEPLVSMQAAVEGAQRGVFYDVAFSAAPSLANLAQAHPNLEAPEIAARFERELAVQALPYWSSASITVPALTGPGGSIVMAPAPATSRIRYSCGATLISPSFAITAGHCPTSDTQLTELRLQLYRPTAKLEATWHKATKLSGTFPLLEHPQLSRTDGYLLDEFSCIVRTRCYGGAENIACQNPSWDVALLECEGRPGDKYGFVNLGPAGLGTEALVHWKHEVLDVHTDGVVPPDLEQHYVEYAGPSAQNYHYFESGNQLLPLRSISWPDGSPTSFVSNSSVDVHGCHGTSGSGVLARVDDSPEYRLVGPAAHGGPSFGNRLCQQVPNPGGPVSGQGTYGMGVVFDNPSVLVAQYAEELARDCRQRDPVARDTADLPFDVGSHRPSAVYSFLTCALDPFGQDGTIEADRRFGAYAEKLVDDASDRERVVDAFELEANADYRLALYAQSLRECAGCTPPSLRVGEVSVWPAAELTDGITLLTHLFAAPASGPLSVAIEHGGSGLALGGFTLLREGQVNSFDAIEDRLEASLYAVGESREVLAGPVPMRFAGDGSAGFQASLRRGERLALSRQALGPGRRWSARLGSSSFEELLCGLLDLRGSPAATANCAAFFQLDDRVGTAPRLAFFVELPLGSSRESADITYVTLASDLARDPDQDLVPDVVDNCPGDWNAAQGDCSEEPASSGEGGAAGAEAGAGGAESGGASSGGAGGASGGARDDSGGDGAIATAGMGVATGAGATAGSLAPNAGADSLGGDGVAEVRGEADPRCSCRLVARSGLDYRVFPFGVTLLLFVRRRRRHLPGTQ